MATPAEDPIVAVRAGKVRGRWRGEPGTPGGSAAFLGIPFARPPVGALRFAAPVPAEPWDGVRDAGEHGATPQRRDEDDTLIPEPSVPGTSTLNVNVFTPRPGGAPELPVLVYIHGGGFVSGSPASPWYDGAAFARDGVVTVTVSYRLGFDGFGHIEGAPGNRGVRDWLAALEWVQAHIAAFGGDPGRVTIAGQSAGGGAVLTLLGLPAAQHLFHGVWALSAATADIPVERARALSSRMAELAGVASTRDGFATATERTLTSLQRHATAPAAGGAIARARARLESALAWGPVIDGDLLAAPTADAIAAGIGADKALVIGATDDEFTHTTRHVRAAVAAAPASVILRALGVERATVRAYLRAPRLPSRQGTAAVLGGFVTDSVFRSVVPRIADARGGAPTWTYRFAWPSPVHGWSLHCLDVPFWFDCLDADGVADIAGDRPPRALAAAFHASAVSMVREGRPGWPAWSAAPGTTRVFGGAPAHADVESDGYADVRALV